MVGDQKAALDATSSGYMELTEGVVSANIPNAVLYVLGLATGNWWMTLAGDCAVAILQPALSGWKHLCKACTVRVCQQHHDGWQHEGFIACPCQPCLAAASRQPTACMPRMAHMGTTNAQVQQDRCQRDDPSPTCASVIVD